MCHCAVTEWLSISVALALSFDASRPHPADCPLLRPCLVSVCRMWEKEDVKLNVSSVSSKETCRHEGWG